MMRITILLVLFSGMMHAQITSEYSLQSDSGYEFNIFKFPESFFDSERDTLLGKSDIYRSSFYQQVSFRGLFNHKFNKRQAISLRLSPRGRFYLEDAELNYYTLYSRLRYQHEFRRTTKWEMTARYNYRERDGENLDDSELRTPLGYGHLELESALLFRLYKQNRARIALRYANRDYKDGLEDDLRYNLWGVDLVFRNVFKRLAGYHSYGVEINLSRRLYERSFFDVEVPDEIRDWRYVRAEAFYRYPFSTQWELRAGVAWGMRKDQDEDRFSYREVRPSIRLDYEGRRSSFRFTASYTSRGFEKLRATDSDGLDLGLLQFDYLRLQLRGEQKLAKNLALTYNGYVNNRNSNRTNVDKLFFRSYEYYYTGIGLQFEF